jgi:hypothetical protein
VVGAGAAGVSAAVAMADAGLAVTIVEARDRIGGRIFTLQDPKHHTPIELGAEFIHGRPPEIWSLLEAWKVQISEVDGDNWCMEEGKLSPCDFFSEVDEILHKMDDRERDRSFLEFLKVYQSKVAMNPRQQARGRVGDTLRHRLQRCRSGTRGCALAREGNARRGTDRRTSRLSRSTWIRGSARNLRATIAEPWDPGPQEHCGREHFLAPRPRGHEPPEAPTAPCTFLLRMFLSQCHSAYFKPRRRKTARFSSLRNCPRRSGSRFAT